MEKGILKNFAKAFEGKKEAGSEADEKELFAKIAKLEMENDFFKKKAYGKPDCKGTEILGGKRSCFEYKKTVRASGS